VDSSGFGLALGVCLYMFTAHMEVVSIEQDMRDRDRFYDVVRYTFMAITVLHLAFGLLVYCCFGEATGRIWKGGGWSEETILQNIPSGHSITIAVQLAMSANLLLMTPMTLLPVSKAVEDAFGIHRSRRPRIYSTCTRLGLVGSLCLCAFLLPGFEIACALVGSFTGLATFTVPAACYRHFCAHRLGPWRRRSLDLLAGFGVAVTVLTMGQVLFLT